MKNLEMAVEVAVKNAEEKAVTLKAKAQAKQQKAQAMKKEAELLLNNAELLLDESHDAWEEYHQVQKDIKEGSEAMAELKEKAKDNPLAGMLAEVLIFGALKGGK
jgi:hypothetical protein